MTVDPESLRSFVRVAELASFTRAAEQLSLPKARVSYQVRSLETQLGCALLVRTTRSVRTTAEGDALLERAKVVLAEIEEIESQFSDTHGARGIVRIDAPVSLARDALVPKIVDLYRQHPQLSLQLSSTDRVVDVVREGWDCVLRVGQLADSSLMAIRVGQLEMVNCASRSYVQAHGIPKAEHDLDRHHIVYYSSQLGADRPVFEWQQRGKIRNRPMHCIVSVNNTEAFRAAVLSGLGIAQLPRFGVREKLESGELVEVLPALTYPALPVSVLHSHARRVPRRVRVVLDWMVAALRPHLADTSAPGSQRG